LVVIPVPLQETPGRVRVLEVAVADAARLVVAEVAILHFHVVGQELPLARLDDPEEVNELLVL
jgi:hypothetical protein